jgi:MAF protein
MQHISFVNSSASMNNNTTSASVSQLVLASTSPFRRELLGRLGLKFTTASPNIDESAQPDEKPESLVKRLSMQKAVAVSADYPSALIIGSDQVAALDEHILGKPGDHDRACEQLRLTAGRKVTFYTGLCLLNSVTGNMQVHCEPFHVFFRPLDKNMIENYLRREQPYNCAGSFKSEGLGITLFDKLKGDDPNALIGLPMIRLVSMLWKEGVDPLADPIPFN